jgi:hypothetical protein
MKQKKRSRKIAQFNKFSNNLVSIARLFSSILGIGAPFVYIPVHGKPLSLFSHQKGYLQEPRLLTMGSVTFKIPERWGSREGCE